MNSRGLKIISCGIFLSIFCLLFCKITWVFRGNLIEAREDIQGFKNQGEVDVVLVGGSTLLRFYNPLQAWKETGITSYNYATSAAKFDLLKKYIEDSRETNKAKLYVVNVRTILLLTQKVDESSLRNWSDSLDPMSLVRIGGINDFVFARDWNIKDIPSFYFDIIKYHSNKKALSTKKQWLFLDLKNIYNIDKGFDPYVYNVPFKKKEWRDRRIELSKQQGKALNDILDYCDKEKITVLFICCPYIFSETDEGIINTCGDIIRDRGYEFINFNEYYDEIGLDFNTDFNDINHVNYFGSIKYTHYLINYISNNYQLPNHKGEPQYSRWESDYESFSPTMDKWQSKLTNIVKNQMEAKKIGEQLHDKHDFYQWYVSIKNKNYSVIIRMNEIPHLSKDNPMYMFYKDFSIDTSKRTHIGIWSAEKSILSTSDKLSAKAELGKGGGRQPDICEVSLESQTINVGGVDYVANESPIQVVVYDSNFKKVIDNVNIQLGADGSVLLQRPS